VLVAAAANVVVAVAKGAAGLVSGSAAMQAEAAHSAADTITEAFLFVAARRGGREPDLRHPLGHGQETYVWAFLAAVATFGAGAGFALVRGVDIILHGERGDVGAALPLLVLAFAFLMEVESLPGVVLVFMAVFIGPRDVLVAAKVHFASECSAADIERIADEAEQLLRARFAGVGYVFLDPTQATGEA
jgi:divalent metal cation (Fe/Co/Zn/Cd) transporter